MKRSALVLIDGEHYPSVVHAALEELAHTYTVSALVFLGGQEKLVFSGQALLESALDLYGYPLLNDSESQAEEALVQGLQTLKPEVVVDLSDEPVLGYERRFRLISLVLAHHVTYMGGDFTFVPPKQLTLTRTASLAVIATAKRAGKTALSAYSIRLFTEKLHLTRRADVVALAMGRGGPKEPEVVKAGDTDAVSLLARVKKGGHAASDYLELAALCGVTTVGCRRCGAGLAGAPVYSNVPQGARLAEALNPDFIVIDGSGSSIPPVRADSTVLVSPAYRSLRLLTDYLGPYRLAYANLLVVTAAETPFITPKALSTLRQEVAKVRPGLPIIATVLRPVPAQPVGGLRLAYFTTAPQDILPRLVGHLEETEGAHITFASTALARREQLAEDLALLSQRLKKESLDGILVEIKAAAIDVVGVFAAQYSLPLLFCNNEPRPLPGEPSLEEALLTLARQSLSRTTKAA